MSSPEQVGAGKYYVAYILMLVAVGIEVTLAYRGGGSQLLVGLLLLAFFGATLGVLYFMNLASENRNAILGFAVFTLFVLATINYSWTDSFRILLGAPFAK